MQIRRKFTPTRPALCLVFGGIYILCLAFGLLIVWQGFHKSKQDKQQSANLDQCLSGFSKSDPTSNEVYNDGIKRIATSNYHQNSTANNESVSSGLDEVVKNNSVYANRSGKIVEPLNKSVKSAAQGGHYYFVKSKKNTGAHVSTDIINYGRPANYSSNLNGKSEKVNYPYANDAAQINTENKQSYNNGMENVTRVTGQDVPIVHSVVCESAQVDWLLVFIGGFLLLLIHLPCVCNKCFIKSNYSTLPLHQIDANFDCAAHILTIQNHKFVVDATDDESSKITSLIHGTWVYAERLGRDAKSLSHNGLAIKQVLRVRNNHRIKNYLTREGKASTRPTMLSKFQRTPILTRTAFEVANTDEVETNSISTSDPLSLQPHEVYLFHGTKLENIPSILEEGFDMSRARTGLYGRAIYLAESSEKADQYTDYTNNRRTTDLAMLVVRTTLGSVQCLEEEMKLNQISYKGDMFRPRKPKYDTVVAGFNKRFREFLVFDQEKVLPEFVVIYDRTQKESQL